MSERGGRWPTWTRPALPLLVLVVALVIGSGVFSGKAQTPAQRAAAIERVVKCPSCSGISVAESTQPTALAVRDEIKRQVAEGRSSADIEQTLVGQYGSTILLEPPDSAGFALIWIIPIVLGAAAVVVIGGLFWRRTRQFAQLRESQHEEVSQ
ncbi:MAG TPA: cytochrome c-type biogenesis protein CcmH [Acidimicrobiales bacterium]|jgi:cytochrome c-type biogenesis protein CcmH|nr:cytochrome c-type biogenesis protein CcmH [Acidimicrobiales bacterium]